MTLDIKERVSRVVLTAIDDVNETLSGQGRLSRSPGETLIGESGKLDSLGYVNLVIALEKRFEEEFGHQMSFSGSEQISHSENPFQTVGALIDHVSGMISET